MSNYSVNAIFNATGVGRFTEAFRSASRNVDRLQHVGGKMKSIGKGMTAGITLPVVAMGASIIKTGAQFDDQMSTVKAVTSATGKQMIKLRDQAKDMGSTTRYSASEAAEGQEMLARAGFKVNDILTALPSVLSLASAGNVELGQAADITSNILSGFGMEATETARVADVLAQASADSNTDVQALGEAFKYVGPVASTLGVSIEDTAASIGVLGDAGIAGGQAGNMLKRGLLNMSKETGPAADEMDRLGMNMFDAEGNMKSMPEVLKELENGTKGMSNQQKIASLQTIFGAEAVAGFAAMLDVGSEELGLFSDELANSEGAAKRMSDEMEDNLAGSFRSLSSAFEGAKLALYELGDGAVRSFIDWLTQLVRSFTESSDSTKQLVVVIALIAAAIGPVLIVLGLLIESVGRVSGVFKLLGGAIKSVSLPMVAMIVTIGLVVAAIVQLWRTNEEFRNNITTIWESIKQIITLTFQAIQPAIQIFVNSLGAIIAALMPVISWVVGVAASFIEWVAHIMETYAWITTLIQVIAVIVGAIAGFIAILAVVAQIITVVTTVISVLSSIATVLGVVIAFLTSPIGLVIVAITALVAIVIWLGGKFEWLGNLLDGVASFMSNAWNKFLGFFGAGTEEAAEDAGAAIEKTSEKGKEDLDGLATEGTASAEKLKDGVTTNVDEMSFDAGSLMGDLQKEGQLDFAALNQGATSETGAMSDIVTGDISEMTGSSSDMLAQLEADGNIDMSHLNTGATSEAGSMSDNVTSDISGMTGDSSKMLAQLEKDGNFDMSSLNTGVSSEVSDMSKGVKSDVSDMESSASGDFSSLTSEMSKNAQKLKSEVSKSFAGMGADINKEMGNIRTIASGAMTGLSTDFSKGLSMIIKSVRASFNAINNTFTTETNKMSTTTSKGLGLMNKSYQASMTSINNSVSQGTSMNIRIVRSGNTAMVSSVRSMHTGFYNAGIHAMNGLARGLNANRGYVNSVARNIAVGVSNTLRRALKVKSPSRITMAIGGYVGEGLALGLDGMRRKVNAASEMLGLAATPEIAGMNIGSNLNNINRQVERQLTHTFDSNVSVGKQPAYITVRIGNQEFDTFVKDITEVQDRNVDIREAFR